MMASEKQDMMVSAEKQASGSAGTGYGSSTLLPHVDPAKPRLSGGSAGTRFLAAHTDNRTVAHGLARVLPTMALGLMVIGCSSGLISFNKYLLQAGSFPFPVALVMIHTFFSSVFCAVLLVARPAMFPSLTDPEKKVHINWGFLVRRALPVALLFTGQLVLSNMAYKYASVPFLQMLKEGNVIIVYFFSLVVALEVWRTRQATILFSIFGATLITVRGELHLSWVGFAVQGASCFFESGKIIMQGVLLTGAGQKKLDVLSYVVVVSPLCFLLLSVLALGSSASSHVGGSVVPAMDLPQWSHIEACKWLLFANTLVAVTLNVSIAAFIKCSSPLIFVLVGVAKDAMIVLGSAVVLREPVGMMQACGFAMQLALIGVWSLLKTFPEKFEDGIVIGLRRVLGGDRTLII